MAARVGPSSCHVALRSAAMAAAPPRGLALDGDEVAAEAAAAPRSPDWRGGPLLRSRKKLSPAASTSSCALDAARSAELGLRPSPRRSSSQAQMSTRPMRSWSSAANQRRAW